MTDGEKIVLSNARIVGHATRAAGQVKLIFEVDESYTHELQSFYKLGVDTPVAMAIVPLDAQANAEVDKKELSFRQRTIYAIEQLAKLELGYTDDGMRTVFTKLTGKASRKDMDDQELQKVRDHFEEQRNDPTGRPDYPDSSSGE